MKNRILGQLVVHFLERDNYNLTTFLCFRLLTALRKGKPISS